MRKLSCQWVDERLSRAKGHALRNLLYGAFGRAGANVWGFKRDIMTTKTDFDRDLSLRLRIDALLANYIHCIDEDRLEEWHNYFTDDGRYKVVTRENYDLGLPVALIYCDGRGMFKDRISALRTANIYEPHVYCHMVSALKILDSSGPNIKTQSNFTVTRTMSEGNMMTFLCGKTIDTVTEIDGDLKFKERTVILDSRRIDTLLVIPA
jgi:anthranilate 1,2-dioxygenase small subunit